MLEKIKSLPLKSFIQEMRDIRMVGFLVFGIIVLLVTWSAIGTIQVNYELQKKIARLEQQNTINELENTNVRLRNEYYNTDQYIELNARKQFGKAAPGETAIVIPKDVALAHTVDMPKAPTITEKAEATKPFYQKNFEAWMSFFFDRNQQG